MSLCGWTFKAKCGSIEPIELNCQTWCCQECIKTTRFCLAVERDGLHKAEKQLLELPNRIQNYKEQIKKLENEIKGKEKFMKSVL